MIKFISVTREYPRFALRDVNLHVRKGDFVLLTGHSGAGKSTLLKLIHMAETPSEGEVRVSGFSSKRMRRNDVAKLRRKLGVVFQEFKLLEDRNAEDNVAFALEVTGTKRSAIRPRAARLLAQVGLAARGRAMPEELSGGERQRVAIARALANEPFILLADEPTGNLDEFASAGIVDLFREINASGTTVVMATHDLDFVRQHPELRTVELSEGQIVFDSLASEAGAL